MASTEERPGVWLVDLDGTLYHPLPVKLAMGLELLLFGWSVLPVIRAFRHAHEELRAAGGGEGDPYGEQLARAAAACGRPLEQVRSVVQRWMIERPGRWLRLFRRRGLIAELRAFAAGGGRLALVSDYPAQRKLAALQLGDLFGAVVANGEEGGPGRLKPDPAGFLAAAAALDAAPADCLVIGDRKDADGLAAERAGMAFRLVG